jgi:hypothetical protein
METHNPDLAAYVEKKIIDRLYELAKFRSEEPSTPP